MLRKLFIPLLVCGALYLGALPFLTAYELQTAGIRNDTAALASRVDLPLLRANLKRHLAEVLDRQLDGGLRNTPFSALVDSIGSTIIEPLVDQYVTEEAITLVMQGNNPLQSRQRNASELGGGKRLLDGASMRYTSLDRFTVTIDNGTSLDRLRLILHRRGFRWVLAEVRLPV